MHKKRVVVLIISLIIVISLIYFRISKSEKMDEGLMAFSEYAPDWVDKLDNITEEEKTVKIDIIEATSGKGDILFDHQRYFLTDGSVISLYYDGVYDGNSFKSNFVKDEKILMGIGNMMNPSDGIIEGYSLLKEEGYGFVIYFFIDKDWKEKSGGNINLIWGNDLGNSETLKSRAFDFSNEKDGVYIDKITDDVSWFVEQNPLVGRIFFGEINLKDVIETNFNKTFIMLT